MNNQIHNRETRILFELGALITAKELAILIESELRRDGFEILSTELSLGADSADADGMTLLRGERLENVIPEPPQLASFAGARYVNREFDLKISVRFGIIGGTLFNAGSKIELFSLVANCRMDRNMLPFVVSSITEKEELRSVLKNSKRTYALVKKLYGIVGAERCIGVDSKNYTDSFFEDPPAFYFARNKPSIPSELLESTS